MSLSFIGRWMRPAIVAFACVALLAGTERDLLGQSWSVQDLHDAVAAGGDVVVPAGEYLLTSSLVVDKPTNLTLSPGAVLVADWNPTTVQSVLSVLPGADGSSFHGVNIDGQGNFVLGMHLGAWMQTSPGVWGPVGVNNVQIQDMTVKNVGESGLTVLSSDNVTIRNVSLDGTALVDVQDRMPALLVRNQSTNVLVEGITVRNAGGKGVGINDSEHITLRDAIVYDTQWDAGDGIHTTRSNNILIDNARVFDPQGSALKISRNAQNVTVINSMFNKNNRGVGRALHLQGGRDSHLSDTLFLGQLDNTTIRIADHPGYDPSWVVAPADNNTFENNHIVHRNGGYVTNSGDNNVFVNSLEGHRPLISWMKNFGLLGMPMHNLTTGEVHFDGGGFDIGRVGQAPGEFNTLFGRWGTVQGDVTVMDAESAGFDAFVPGTRFVRMQGGENGVDRPRLGSVSTNSGQSGDVTQSSFAFRVDEGILRARLQGNGGFFADILFKDDGTIEGHYGEDNASGVPGLSGRFTLDAVHNVGQWNVVVIDYVLGADQSFLSINGGTAELVGPRSVNSALNSIDFRNEGDAALVAYISAIPEPATAAIMTLGAATLLCRRHGSR